jgi:hypothetical protein
LNHPTINISAQNADKLKEYPKVTNRKNETFKGKANLCLCSSGPGRMWLSILGHGETRNKWLTKKTGCKDAEKRMGGNRVGDSDKHNYPLKMRGTWKGREGISPSETLKGKKGVRFL